MSKLKTNKTAKKRFKITGSGKIMRRKAYNSHMFLHKSGGQKRRLAQEVELAPGERKRMAKILAE